MIRSKIDWPVLLSILSLFWTFSIIGGTAYAASDIFHQYYDVNAQTRLEIDNKNGDVTVQRWDQPQIEVYAEKQAQQGEDLDKVKIEVTVGETIRVETIHLVENPNVSVFYRIHIPTGVIVPQVRSSNGQIMISDTRGDIVVKTSNGKIIMERIDGSIEAKTSNGAIRIQAVQGSVAAETSNESITIREIMTVLRAETSNGDISVDIPAMPENDVQLKTSNASITLSLAPDLDAAIRLKTSNGAIHILHQAIITQSSSKHSFQGTIGKGGKTIFGKTSNGSITLEILPSS